MYGWRGRIGIIVPSVNVVVEPETALMAPVGVAVHAARMGLKNSNELAGMEDMERTSEVAAVDLAAARVEAIGFACTTASFHAGAAGEQRLHRHLEELAGVPVITAAGAVADALSALGARRITMATPYSARVNRMLTDYLAERGFEVVYSSGMGIVDTASIGFVNDESVFRAAKEASREEADALFLSCTNLPTVSLIASLEADTALPVVTSNQALAWALLTRIGVCATGDEFGRLMRIGPHHQPARV